MTTRADSRWTRRGSEPTKRRALGDGQVAVCKSCLRAKFARVGRRILARSLGSPADASGT